MQLELNITLMKLTLISTINQIIKQQTIRNLKKNN